MDIAEGPCVHEPESLCCARLVEEAFAGADDDGVDLQVECVDEVVLDQRLSELWAMRLRSWGGRG